MTALSDVKTSNDLKPRLADWCRNHGVTWCAIDPVGREFHVAIVLSQPALTREIVHELCDFEESLCADSAMRLHFRLYPEGDRDLVDLFVRPDSRLEVINADTNPK